MIASVVGGNKTQANTIGLSLSQAVTRMCLFCALSMLRQ